MAASTPPQCLALAATMGVPWSSAGYEIYALALLALWLVFAGHRWYGERRASVRRRQAVDDGASEPLSLHPVIDPARCVGCGACTHACPEGDIIGMIGEKAQLIDPGSCIGHGACKTACPVGAIELVFGTARRGVDIPVVSPTFESNVPGLFIAGELGGMGLIANAIEQGRLAIDAIVKRARTSERDVYDVVIVGGGPAGIAASLAAKDKGLRFLTLEQDAPGGTVARYPRGKLVMTRPAELPLYGKFRLRRVRKERLLTLWQKVIRETGITIHSGVRVEHIMPLLPGFELTTSEGRCRANAVVLATGRRGSPRRLGIPGEDLPKVVYSLDTPIQYSGQYVVVVGGGNSAIEAAVELAQHPVASVTLSYRGAQFDRANPVNRRALDDAVSAGKLNLVLESQVVAIEQDHVIIERSRQRFATRNDVVIICIGGLLPVSLFADLGIHVETKYGTA
jgi:thioredoxin reductase (NADPH)